MTKTLDELSPRERNTLLRNLGRSRDAQKALPAPSEPVETDDETYRKAVGYALQYGIKVYQYGCEAKPLETLHDEIRAHEREHRITNGLFRRPSGHKALIYCGSRASHKPHPWVGVAGGLNCPGKDYWK